MLLCYLSINMLYNTTVYLLHHFSVYKILVFTSQLLQREWNRIERNTPSKSTKKYGSDLKYSDNQRPKNERIGIRNSACVSYYFCGIITASKTVFKYFRIKWGAEVVVMIICITHTIDTLKTYDIYKSNEHSRGEIEVVRT